MKRIIEAVGDFSKESDKWFDDLYDISEAVFEKGETPDDDFIRALVIADKYRPYAGQGSTSKEYEDFKREILSLRLPGLKGFQQFLKNLNKGDYDEEAIIDKLDFDELSDKEFGLWSNDREGNASVVRSVMDLYSQGITYFGSLEDLRG